MSAINQDVIWYALTAAFLSIVWFVRLEAKVNYIERDHKDHKSKIDLQTQQLLTISTSLAKIEGFLYSENNKKGD